MVSFIIGLVLLALPLQATAGRLGAVASTPGRHLTAGRPSGTGGNDGAASAMNGISVSETATMVQGAAIANDPAVTSLAAASGVGMAQHAAKKAQSGVWGSYGGRKMA
eukprot:jgi/Chrzof1/13582/Cz08g03050.t1